MTLTLQQYSSNNITRTVQRVPICIIYYMISNIIPSVATDGSALIIILLPSAGRRRCKRMYMHIYIYMYVCIYNDLKIVHPLIKRVKKKKKEKRTRGRPKTRRS